MVQGCVVSVCCGGTHFLWRLPLPGPRAHPVTLAALLKRSIRHAAGTVTRVPAARWKPPPAVLREFSERVCMRVCACSERAVECGKGKGVTLVFISLLTAQELWRPPLPPAALPFLSSQSCPMRSGDKSRFPLLLPGIQAQTLQAAAPDCLPQPFIFQSSPRPTGVHLASPPSPPPSRPQLPGLCLAGLCP